MRAKLRPPYIGFTPKKNAESIFSKPTKQISLKPKNDVRKIKNYFENVPQEYDFYVKDKNNIYVGLKNIDFHFKISLSNFLQIFQRGDLAHKKFQIHFFYGKLFLGQDLDENSLNYSAWYQSGKKNFTELVNGGVYITTLGEEITYLEGLKPKDPYISFGDKYEPEKIKASLELGTTSSHKKEELVFYTGKIDSEYKTKISLKNDEIYYYTDVDVSDTYTQNHLPRYYIREYKYKDKEGNVYEIAQHTCKIFHPITLSSGKTIYAVQHSYMTDEIKAKIASLTPYNYLSYKTTKNL